MYCKEYIIIKLVCNSFNHSPHCSSYRNNALKGAAASPNAVNNQQPKQLVFNKSELNIVSKTLELCKYFIGKNQQMFQQPKDILNELSTSINIISARQNKNNNSVKGASDNINNNPFKSIDNIRKMFGLIN